MFFVFIALLVSFVLDMINCETIFCVKAVCCCLPAVVFHTEVQREQPFIKTDMHWHGTCFLPAVKWSRGACMQTVLWVWAQTTAVTSWHLLGCIQNNILWIIIRFSCSFFCQNIFYSLGKNLKKSQIPTPSIQMQEYITIKMSSSSSFLYKVCAQYMYSGGFKLQITRVHAKYCDVILLSPAS